MASSIVKGVGSLLTPVKPYKINLLPSPINIERKSLSATSKKSAFSSPSFGPSNSYSNALMKDSACSVLPDKSNSIQYNAVRCLFSPQRSPKPPKAKNCCLTPDNVCCRDRTVPSFDTPLRNSFTAKEFYKNSENLVLGRGSYGLVVKGRYKNKNIAVKIMSRCQEQTDMLKSEMNALNIKHSNIIQVYQVIVEPNKNIGFVFMELYSNTNLEHILQCEVVHLLDKLGYLKQIGSALQYCHSNGILHLDVKPKNVMVNTINKTCKLCDFGSSVNKADIETADKPRKGTLKYSAPELLKGDNPTEKSDVYSFGITMWQTLYQQVPYDKEDLQEVVYKVVKHNYRPASCKAVLSIAVCHIYEACWQADPELRPSMSQVLDMMG